MVQFENDDILFELRPLLLLPRLLSRPCLWSLDELFLLRPASSLPQDPEYSVTKMEASFSNEDFIVAHDTFMTLIAKQATASYECFIL